MLLKIQLSQTIRSLLFVIIACSILQLPAWADYTNPSYQKAMAQMTSRDYDAAVTSFAEAIGMSGADPKLYFLRGQCFYHLQNYKQALTDFDKSLQLQPKNYEALLWKGTAYAKTGDEKKATQAYLTAIRANPGLVSELQRGGRANASTINPRREGTGRAYLKAVDLYSAEGNNTVLPARRSRHAVSDNQSSSALSQPVRRIEDLDDAIRQNPSNAALYYQRAKAYRRAGNRDRALADFSDAIKLNPMVAKYYLDRARLYHEENKQSLCQLDIKRAQSVDKRVPKHIVFGEREQAVVVTSGR